MEIVIKQLYLQEDFYWKIRNSYEKSYVRPIYWNPYNTSGEFLKHLNKWKHAICYGLKNSIFKMSIHKEATRTCSVTQSCLTVTMDCSTPGFPVLHYLLEFAQSHVHWVSDAILSVVPFSSHLQSFPASESFAMSQFFASGGQSIGVSASTSVLPMNVSFRIDWLDLLAVQGTLKNLLQDQFKSINSSVLSLLYGPTLTSIHDYWKNHSFDYRIFVSKVKDR